MDARDGRLEPFVTEVDGVALPPANFVTEGAAGRTWISVSTRHLPRHLGPRTVQWAEIDGRRYHVVGGRVSHAVVNPTFDPVAKAGAMHAYFRGNPEGRNPLDFEDRVALAVAMWAS